jgi:hypothetical protein
MPPNCGGCPICKGQVADVGAAKIAHKINVLDSGESQIAFMKQIQADLNDQKIGGPEAPIRMPVMKVNGAWIQGPFLKDLKPHLKFENKL